MDGKHGFGDFSWSLRRDRTFDFCPRGYFLRYYAARGGRDPENADGENVRLCELCSGVDDGTFLQSVLNTAMRDIFYAPEDAAAPTLRVAASRIFDRWFTAAWNGYSGGNPRPRGLLDGRIAPERLRGKLGGELLRRCERLEAGDWPELADIPWAHRRKLPFPLEVHAGDLPCHTPTVLVWQRDGVLNLVEGFGSPPSGEAAALVALMHRMCALNLPGGDPGRVRSLAFDAAGRLSGFDADFDASSALRLLRKKTEKLLAFRRDDGSWNGEDFPVELKNCEKCVFRPVCGAEKSASGY